MLKGLDGFLARSHLLCLMDGRAWPVSLTLYLRISERCISGLNLLVCVKQPRRFQHCNSAAPDLSTRLLSKVYPGSGQRPATWHIHGAFQQFAM